MINDVQKLESKIKMSSPRRSDPEDPHHEPPRLSGDQPLAPPNPIAPVEDPVAAVLGRHSEGTGTGGSGEPQRTSFGDTPAKVDAQNQSRRSRSAEPTEPGTKRKSSAAAAGTTTNAGTASAPTSGRKTVTGTGAIALADKKAQDLAGKVKTFFSQEEKTGEIIQQKPIRRPKKIYANSYRLRPHIPYNRDAVQAILEYTMDEMMRGVTYHSETAAELAIRIAETIRYSVLNIKFDRYKVVVITNIGPLNRQGLHIGFRTLMDKERDTYNMYTSKSSHAFCTTVVYGVYYE